MSTGCISLTGQALVGSFSLWDVQDSACNMESNGNMIHFSPKLTFKLGPLRDCRFLTPGSKGSLGIAVESSCENPG